MDNVIDRIFNLDDSRPKETIAEAAEAVEKLDKEKKEKPSRRTLIIDMGTTEEGHQRVPGVGLSEKDNMLIQHFMINILAHRVKMTMDRTSYLSSGEPTITFTGYEELKMLLSSLFCKVTDLANVLVKEHNVEIIKLDDFEKEFGSLGENIYSLNR